MSSECKIDDIYSALSDIDVTGANVRDIEEIKLDVRAGDLPCRMLLPSTIGDFNFIAMGPVSKVEWEIRDLVLWSPLSLGAGVQEYASDMITFIKNYVNAIRENINLTDYSTIKSVTFKMGPVGWAEGDYWAIDILLTIEEII